MTGHERLLVRREIATAPERVFEAWTDPSLIVRWWGAGGVKCTAAEMDVEVGGTYRIANLRPDGVTVWITGTFREVDPPSRLAYTWAMEPVDSDTDHSLVEVTFDGDDDTTLVTVVHTRIPDADAREMNEDGWLGCLEGLARLMPE